MVGFSRCIKPFAGCTPSACIQEFIRKTAATYRYELSQLDSSLSKHLLGLPIHAIPKGIDDFADSYLNNLDAAGQTRTGIAIQPGTLADSLPSSFKQGIFFSMQTKAGAQAHSTALSFIAARTSSLSTVFQAPGGAIVAGRHNSVLRNKHTAHAPLHAVASLGSKGGKSHEILIPCRPQSVFICEIQLAQSSIEVCEIRGCVEKLDSGSGYERKEASGRGVEMGI